MTLPILRPQADRRPQGLTGILFVLKTGIPWQDLPAEMGCGMTCWRRLHALQQDGVWFKLRQILLNRLDDAGKINWSRAAIDSTFARAFGGVEGSGRNPTDRAKAGVKQQVLAGDSTPASVPEVKELLPLVDTCGPLDEEGEPRRRPKKVYAGRAYDSEPHRQELRRRGIDPKLTKRRAQHGSGMGSKYRWVVERSISWLHGLRKLRFVTEKFQETQFAFLNLALSFLCLRFLKPSLC